MNLSITQEPLGLVTEAAEVDQKVMPLAPSCFSGDCNILELEGLYFVARQSKSGLITLSRFSSNTLS